MFVIDTKRTKTAAERLRRSLVSAQEVVDGVTRIVQGHTVEPPADEVYRIVPQGRSYAVVIDDPSAR